jgi:hypothetical protein
MPITSKTKTTKVYTGKNGFTSTFTKVGTKWKKTGGSASSWRRKPRKTK